MNEYKNLESTIKDFVSRVPMLDKTDYRYSRICNTIRSVYEQRDKRLEKDQNDQVAVGSYMTKYFEVSPKAQILYDNLPKNTNPAAAENSAIAHDRLFALEKEVLAKKIANPEDVKRAEELHDRIMSFAKDMNLEKEHEYLNKNLDTIKSFVKDDSKDSVEDQIAHRFASPPARRTPEPKDTDIDSSKFLIRRDLKAQRKLKIIDDQETYMSNLKNTYGFSSSLLDAIRSVHETSNQDVEQIDEISNKAKAKYLGRAVGDLTLRSQEHGFHTGANFYGKRTHPPHDYADAKRKIKNRQVGIYHATKNIAKEEVDLDEADQTYPFKANQLAPLVVQLRALLNFLSKSGALKKSMREHAELVEAYIGEEITEEQLEEMISFIDDLMEGRPKGSKNKSKMASAPKPEARSERGEASSSEDDDYEDAHPTASRDGRHIIPELNGAAGDKKGDTVQTSGGQRHVPQHVATKMVSHLMSLKPAERAEHSAHIFNGSVPKVKTLNHVKTNVLIKQMGSEKKIGSDAGVKRGRGRPKKAV